MTFGEFRNRAWPRLAGLALILALSACASTGSRQTFAESAAPAPAAARGSMLWPVDQSAHVINSTYGVQRHRHEFHRGIDIGAPRGATVFAAAAGVVTLGRQARGYGNFIVIEHGNGLSTLYAHLLDTRVRNGDRVNAGQAIGRVGKSGNATGYHLHFEVHRGNKTTDPLQYLSRGGSPLANNR